ncbi:uncharacterized protein LOC117537838 [Gymnodraco acuticeps]|uniref:Uncharacterized protein LOC117537838 n=1 Tax=Gymnodraco acuticeps TaxID=8218 RepID=A0A6P8T613_GYMAC|nr:uncharacterized protein LOC117537838 [Gymnodraco acuticeps]
MSEFRRIVMSSFLMLLLHFPAAAGNEYYRIVRAGDEVTLPCDNVIHDQDKCESTRWLFRHSRGSPYPPAVTLFEDGQIHKGAKAKSDRLRVTEKCSLVIKKVTEEDAGFYVCRQFRSGEQQGPDSDVLLSVVSINTYRSELFTCEVTNGYTREVHLFPFSPQSSGEDTKPATTKSNMNSGEDAGKVTSVSPTWTTVRMRAAGETTNTASEDNHTEQEDNNKGLLRLILVSVGLAALIITVVTVNIWTRAKGSKAQTEENMEQNDEDEDEAEYENIGGASASV